MLTITVEDYHGDPAKRRFADEIMERFDLDRDKGVELRISEGSIEFDWVWLGNGQVETHTTLLTPLRSL